MRLKRAGNVRALFALSLTLLLQSCQDEVRDIPQVAHEVGFQAGGVQTRTEMLSNGLSATWTRDDVIAMWAKASSGSYMLTNQPFKTYGADKGLGIFTSTLAEPMPDNLYTYYCCYPIPERVDGMTATFNVPAHQDGKVSGGADVMIGTPVNYGPIRGIPELDDGARLSVSMNRMLHQFRLYIPDTDLVLWGDTAEKITITFPKDVVGKISCNLEDPGQAPVLTEGSSKVTLSLAENLGVSSGDDLQYACFSIAPTTFSSGDRMVVRLFTATHIAYLDPINLRSRTFEPGHSTPVALKLIGKEEYCRVRFTVSGNNLGENATSVKLTAPSGCVWGDTESNIYTYSPGHEIQTGETFEIVFENVDAYRALSGQNVTVTFDTEHVTTSQTITLPDMSKGNMTELSAALPYLLYEDFSSVHTFSSNDNYSGGIISGSKDAVSFLNGWTAGRAGAQAGKCIRIAARRETSARYHARVDSAPIIALKKPANLNVTFDYGGDNEYSEIKILDFVVGSGDYPQTFWVGYVTSTKAYESGATDGTFEGVNSWKFMEYSGSYDSLPNNETFTLHSVPAGLVRISWRSEVEDNAGANNTTCWLYIDNVKVQIAK